MPSSSDRPDQYLHEANVRLSLLLDGIDTNHETAGVVYPQQIAGLLSELMQAGQFLRGLPSDPEPSLSQELSAYHENVERLRDVLPVIQGGLLRARARLEQERARVDAAAVWARRSRQTL